MANDYYNHGSYPVTGSTGSSALLRSELDSIAAGFDKMPKLTSDPGYGGMWPDVTGSTKLFRLRDRLFVGGGAAFTGLRNSSQGGFLSTSAAGANWAPRDSFLFSGTDIGLMAVTGFASNNNMDMSGPPTETIGVSGFVIGKKAGRSAWALYADVQFEDGVSGYGIEIAIKNKSGVNSNATPYYAVGGAVGIWMPAGGDATYGGAPNAPNNWAIALGSSASTGQTWNKGIIFFKDSLTGSDGTTGTATAIEMAKGHSIVWRNSGGTALTIRSDSTSGANDIFLLTTNSTFTVAGLGETKIMDFVHSAGAVNYMRVQNVTSGNLVLFETKSGIDPNVGLQFRVQGTHHVRFQSQGSGLYDEFRVGGVNSAPVNYLHAYGTNASSGIAVLASKGADPNVDIRFSPQGTGLVSFGAHSANADAPITGFILIKDSSGNQRKLAVIS